MMPQRTVRDLFWFPLFDQLDIAHARGRTQVIHDRVRLVETLRGENVLVGDALVLIGRPLPVAVKPDVMFPRDFSQSLVIRHYRLLSLLQIPSRGLFALDGFEQRFEITFAETLRALALNDLEKERWAIFHRLGEDLQQITFVIAIDQNPELL